MKLTVPVVVFAFLLVSAVSVLAPIVSAQSNQVTATVNLNYLTVQVTYPSEVMPGNTTTAHVQATAKSSFYLVALTVQVFYADGSSIRQLATKTLATEMTMSTGKSISADVPITIPQDAPRTSLVAAFSENARVTTSYTSYYNSYYYYTPATKYYYYPYTCYGNYSYCYYPYMYYYSNSSYPWYYYCYGYGCSYPSSYYSYYKYYSYPSSSYSCSYTTDVGITSMPYIKANTPEYLSLQSENQQLQQQLAQSQANNQQLQQQLAQSQSDNQRLQQELQNAQQTIDQQNSAANDLNQQLTSNKNLTYGLGGLAAIMAALAVHYRRQRGKIVTYPQQQYAQQQHAATQEQNVPTARHEPGASS